MLPPFDPDAFARDSEVKLHSVPPVTGETTTEAARRLLADGEPEEALFLLARLLEQMPLDTEARALSAECSAALERDCWSLIGPPGGVLEIMVAPAELKGFALDNVSGFLLSLIDGATDVEALLDLAGLPQLLALRHLRSLLSRGIVGQKRRLPPP